MRLAPRSRLRLRCLTDLMVLQPVLVLLATHAIEDGPFDSLHLLPFDAEAVRGRIFEEDPFEELFQGLASGVGLVRHARRVNPHRRDRSKAECPRAGFSREWMRAELPGDRRAALTRSCAVAAPWHRRSGVLFPPGTDGDTIMAKARAKKPTKKVEPSTVAEPLTPQKVHELFGLPGPYEPPPPPIPTKGYTTWWDPGVSIQALVKKYRALFYLQDHDGPHAKQTDAWKWRQIRLTPIAPNRTFAEQLADMKKGDEPASARELVTFLVLHFLATGERLDIDRWRCRDVLTTKRRLIVGPFHPLGLDSASVSDTWKSPGICLSVMCTPVVRRR